MKEFTNNGGDVMIKTTEQVLREFSILAYKEQVEVLFEALDYMESNNRNSKYTCICFAMGYNCVDGDTDRWRK